MSIVGGLDIHRKQITFDYRGTVTGQVCRGQIAPADRAHLRAWLARFAGRADAAFAVEGCTGWRYVAEELAAAGIEAHLAEPADTAFARGRKRHAKTGKTDARHLRMLLAEGRLPECRVPAWAHPGMPGAAGDLSRPADRAHRLGAADPRGAVSPRRPGPGRGHAAHRAGRGRAAGGRGPSVPGRAAAGGHRAGGDRGAGGPDARAAASADRRRPAPDRRQGAGRPAVRGRAGHRAGADLLAGRSGPVLLLPPGGPVRRAGASPSGPRTAKARLGGCPGRDRRRCAGLCTRPARPTPGPQPRTTATTPPSRTAKAASAPRCPRPARSSARPATS
jgi:hypothetical protein